MNGSVTLASLAMLKVHADARRPKDYIDYLKTFAIRAIKLANITPVTREQLHDALLAKCGLSVPYRGCELVLKRLVKEGYFEKKDAQYHLKNELPQENGHSRWAETERRRDAVIARFQSFSLEGHNKSFTVDEAADAFLAFLSDFAIECLRSYAQGTALPEIKRGKKENMVLVSLFIQDIAKTDVDLFNDFIMIVKGHMLANALLCPDLEDTRAKFNEVSFFLDTPIIIDLLGLHGDQDRLASEELVRLVTKVGGKCFVFAHNMSEVEGILKFAEKHYNDAERPNRVIRYMREANLKGSDLTLARANVSDVLKRNKVKEERTPRYSLDYRIDEDALAQVLEESAKYAYPNAKEVDINSIKSIYVLRAGLRPRKLENAKAVMVTPNSSLSSSAWQFGKRFEESTEVSPVITEFSLGNIAWLKAPLEADDLPRLELISRCYAELEPEPGFWDKFLVEVDKLAAKGGVTPEEHAFLRSDALVTKELMNLTLGSESELCEQTVEEVRRRVKDEIARTKNQVISERDKTIEDLTHEKSTLLAAKNAPLQRIHEIANCSGNAVANIIVGCLTVCLIFGLVLPLYATEVPKWAKWGAPIVSGVTIIWSFYNWFTGTSLKHARDKVRSVVADWCERVLKRVFGHSR